MNQFPTYRSLWTLVFGVLFMVGFAEAQTPDNPFEITTRLDSTLIIPTQEVILPEVTEAIDSITTTETNPITDVAVAIDSDNPFELIVGRAESDLGAEHESDSASTNNIETHQSTSTDTILPVQQMPLYLKPTFADNKGALFGTLLALSFLLAFLFAAFRTSFTKAYQNVLNINILKQSYREMSTIGQTPLNLWYVFSWLSMGIFLFLLLRHHEAALFTGFWSNVLACIGITTILLLLKHFVLFFIAYVFPVRKEVRLYNFLLIIFGVVLGVLLVPVNVCIAYLPPVSSAWAVRVALGMLLLFYLLRALRGLLLSNRFLSFHRFHFLLYLCAVELAPIIILLKLGFIYAGK
ncbi:MAG: DUF4271 domain-containing protein [Bacteroidota bacterium]